MRLPRRQSETDIYHVVARGTGRQIIFEDDKDRATFVSMLSDLFGTSEAELYAWCLMSNHIHLLVHASINEMARRMRRLLSRYAIYFNAKTGRVGHLFQERYSSEPVNDEGYLLTVIRYIHQNPVKAKLGAVDEYPWSSYGEYMRERGLCATRFPMQVFGSKDEFVRFHAYDGTGTKCLDVPDGLRSATRAMPDERAVEIAQEVLGETSLDDLKALPVTERNEKIVALKQAGLSIRQIARITGIGRGSIQRASVSNPPSP